MIACKTKKWGNSVGVIIPSEIVREKHIRAGEEVVIDIERKGHVLKKLSGALKFDKPTAELLKESRKSLESRYL